jgi:hypothetical protein
VQIFLDAPSMIHEKIISAQRDTKTQTLNNVSTVRSIFG